MLGRRLAAGFSPELQRTASTEALDRVIAAGIAEARARWPAVGSHDDAFVEALAARLEGELDLGDALARLALADLYLVAGCLQRDRGALAAFERLVRDETARAVARLGAATRSAPEDVVQELLVKLLVGSEGSVPKLAAFAGHGALHAWVKVAAVRTAISMGRRKQEALVDDDALAAIADDGDDQTLAFLKSSYRAEFKRAFEATFGGLPPRARTLLRLQILDHLTIDEVGAFYRVSRATAARWLADARSLLVTGTQDRLIASLALAPGELSELMRLVASSLYSTLPRLLRPTGAPVLPGA